MSASTGLKKEGLPAGPPGDDLGASKFPLCREPWESYYVLRRGILPCCYGNPIIAPMTDYAECWNSAKLQEIRGCLSRGKLSPYCLESLGCPIVQRVLAKNRENRGRREEPRTAPARRPFILRFINKIFLGIPGKAWRLLKRR